MKVKLFNTYEPVIPIWRHLIELFDQSDIKCKVVISKGKYRFKNNLPKKNVTYTMIPRFLRKSKLCNHLFYAIQAIINILLDKSSDIFVFFTQPPLFYITGSYLARIKKIPYFIYIMDLYPDIFFKTNKIKDKGFLGKVLNKMCVNSLNKSNYIVVIGRCMINKLLEKGIIQEKIIFAPNFTEQKLTSDNLNNDFLHRRPYLREKFILLYSGNMGRVHIFSTILQAAHTLESEKDIIFLFIGNGYRRKEIVNAINSTSSSNIYLYDSLSFEDFMFAMNLSDIHYISLREEFKGLLVPSKFYSSLAVGKPVIYEGKGEIALEIQENDIGTVINNGDVESLLNSIKKYKNNPSYTIKQSENALNLHNNKYAIPKIKSTYLSKIVELIKKTYNES